MSVDAPKDKPEATQEAAPPAAPETSKPEDLQDVENTHGERVKLAEDIAARQKRETAAAPEEGADPETDRGSDADASSTDTDTDETPSTDEKPEEETGWLPKEWSFAAIGAWLSGGWSKIAQSFDKLFAGFKKMLPDWLKSDEKEEEKEEAKDKKTSSRTSPGSSGETLTHPSKPTEGLTVKSWEEVLAIQDLPTRIVQATLFAYSTDMNCFTKDGNHCSAWCDSVFNKAGLGGVYNEKERIFCDGYEGWSKRGTRQGLKIMPGDSFIFENGNGFTGRHQAIAINAVGPDANGNYTIDNLSQPSANSDGSGVRKRRTQVIPADKINVVIRPGATQPWNGDGSNLIG